MTENKIEQFHVGRYAFLLVIICVLAIAASFFWSSYQMERDLLEMVRAEARGAFTRDVAFRSWAAGHGGVYAPITEETPPNPYLSHIPERDITTPSGRRLTLINPAYMTRQVHELGRKEFGLKSHITSLKPIRPANAPDEWETAALKSFEKGTKELSSIEMFEGEEYLRLMRPLITMEKCLKCHAVQGYQVGDIRGGISISLPLASYKAITKGHRLNLILAHAFLLIMGLIVIGVGARYIGKRISEREEAETALAESEAKYRTIFTNSPLGILYYDAKGKITACNNYLAEVLGVPTEQQVGFDLLTGLNNEDLVKAIKYSLEGNTSYFEGEYVAVISGKPRVLKTVFEPIIAPDGTVSGCIGILEDITKQARAEEEKQRLENQLQQAQKLESLGVLASGVAHDFNNLLMGIIGSVDMALLDQEMGKATRGNLKHIEIAAQRAAELTKQMLAYSGKGKFLVEPIEISYLVKEMEHLLKVSISKNVVLNYDLAEDLPFIEADATQIRQVVMNFTTNASESIGEKSGYIRLTTGVKNCDRAYLSETYLGEELSEGLYVYIEVTDTGCGMDAETRQSIFDPFFTTKFTGRGLGLAAVLGIVRGHKGAIRIESKLHEGTTFRVLFPVVEKIFKRPKTETATVQEQWQGKGTILLVDDEETIRTVTTEMLKMIGFEVLQAVDGSDGIKVFKEHREKITLVLLDLTMPYMNGEEVFKKIRELDPDMPVILSSGYNETEATSRFAGMGLTDFLQKPYRLAALQEKLQKNLASES